MSTFSFFHNFHFLEESRISPQLHFLCGLSICGHGSLCFSKCLSNPLAAIALVVSSGRGPGHSLHGPEPSSESLHTRLQGALLLWAQKTVFLQGQPLVSLLLAVLFLRLHVCPGFWGVSLDV